ncbi:MAG: DUF2934 domain-containing protein [Candidatus Sulfotelmatobacter sp.]|jgi:hypothetical protein
MARAKSTSGKGRTSKAQPDVSSPASIPDVNAAPSTELATSEIKPEAAPIAATTKPAKPSDAVSENKSETKMFEVRKTKNVVPINLDDEIRRRAYELYKQREPGAGSEADDWFTAEREVMQRYHQQSA